MRSRKQLNVWNELDANEVYYIQKDRNALNLDNGNTDADFLLF